MAAAIVLLLGAAALPTGLSAYDAARRGSDALNVAAGIYGSFVIVIAIAGPIVLTVAGLLSLLIKPDD